MKKRYEVSGMMEWHPLFRIGRSQLQVSFTGGNLCGGASTAAGFETTDPVVQRVIEGSSHYKSGRIRLARTWPVQDRPNEPSKPNMVKSPDLPAQAAALQESPAGVSADKGTATVVIEYEKIGDLRDSLHYKHNVPLSRLLDEAACHREAKNLGITLKAKSGNLFPNLKTEA